MLKKLAIKNLLPGVTVAVVLLAAFLAPTKVGHLGPFNFTCYGYAYGCGGPTVTSVNPNFGSTAGGLDVTVLGTNFNNSGLIVNFGSTASTNVFVNSDTRLTATTPAGAAGTVDVTVTTSAGTSATSPADHFKYLPDSPGQYHPRQPTRLLDTRSNGGKLGANGDYVLDIGGISVPGTATGVIVNVTVTNTTAASALIVYPTGATQPLASNLNWVAGQTVPNLVSVKLGTSGDITLHNLFGSVDVIVDLEGYFAQDSSGTAGEFVTLAPSRITDTRTASGQPNAGLHQGPGGTLNVLVAGAGGVPATGAAAAVLNVTVTNTTAGSALIVYPTGSATPLASNLNWVAGKTIPNRVVVPIGTGGMVSMHNLFGNVDIIVDVNGYFTDSTAAGAVFFSLTPSRILDTRDGTGGIFGPLGPAGTDVVTVAGQGGVPAMGGPGAPKAVIINVTVTGTTAPSAMIVYPDGVATPTASDLNWVGGQTVPNLVVVKLALNGKIDVHNLFGNTHVVIDVVGYFS